MEYISNNKKIHSAWILFIFLMLFSAISYSQQTKQQEKDLQTAQKQLGKAQQALKNEDFEKAEAHYRKAVALNPKDHTAPYNMGTTYYGKSKNEEARYRFQQSVKTARSKEEKHRAFHNLGNTFMNDKMYGEAVEAYKDALRNNPKDEETRYNLALAKELLEKNPPPPDDESDEEQQGSQDQDQDDQDQDDQESDGGGSDDQDDNQENESDPDDSEGDNENDDNDQDDQNPKPGQLSPQQIESLLEAMENEDRNVQEKMNAEKRKGARIKSDKDW